MSTFTCKGCLAREVGCHITCAKYIQEQSVNEAKKKQEQKVRLLDRYSTDKRFKRRNASLRKYGKSHL